MKKWRVKVKWLFTVLYFFPSRILTIEIIKLEFSEVVNSEKVQVAPAAIKRNSWAIISFVFSLFREIIPPT